MSDRPSQPFKAQPPEARSPIAEAMQWVSRITTVALMTVLPIIGGRWLDGRLATSHWGLIGLILGLAVGFWQMLLLAKSAGAQGARRRRPGEPGREARSVESAAASTNQASKRSTSADAQSLTDETAEIAKRIEAALGKKKESPENQSPDREP